ncbi:response regulator [Paenibacillus oryzisoli]|uniref:Two-component system response regulator n=1 Tax=Paenibacillus oryzisoli TaxID=1850517 RepID=A0A198AI52_9BACL|nr:response regulator [Paenibacillus oryzisoli]OAS20711.1 two-component system response regulator [Paenibacillus oryzisoli]
MNSIMIVDDAGFMRLMLKDMLISAGFVVVAEAANGADAVKYYKMLMPDLVIMDITMPEMDGITALIEIKRINPKAQVIMCSAMGQQRMVLEAIKSGAKDFLVKPLQGERVIEAIHNLMNV